jgi:hypothetical protein
MVSRPYGEVKQTLFTTGRVEQVIALYRQAIIMRQRYAADDLGLLNRTYPGAYCRAVYYNGRCNIAVEQN